MLNHCGPRLRQELRLPCAELIEERVDDSALDNVDPCDGSGIVRLLVNAHIKGQNRITDAGVLAAKLDGADVTTMNGT